MKNRKRECRSCVGTVLAVLYVVSMCAGAIASGQEARKGGARPAAVYLSNGEVFTGDVLLTPGRRFKLNVPEGGKLKTTDMVTGEPVQYGKVRTFTFDPIRDIQFYPEREEVRRQWRFIETTDYNEETAEADYSPAEKEYRGEPYPVRYLAAIVNFESGESLQGHLYTVTVYLKTKGKTRRWVLRSKQRGGQGESLDDLVYVRRIRLLDERKDMAAEVEVTLAGLELGPEDAVQALTRESLTPVPTEITGKDTCVVASTFGEDFYLAMRRDGKHVVGWPAKQNAELMALAQDHLDRTRDFYNERQLLGVLLANDGRELLTLVNLRRRVAPTNFGRIGGEWDKERGALVEPWRLSIWRWKYDRVNRELILSARGTFFREIFLPKDPTPDVELSEALWHMERKDDTVMVGTNGGKR